MIFDVLQRDLACVSADGDVDRDSDKLYQTSWWGHHCKLIRVPLELPYMRVNHNYKLIIAWLGHWKV